MCSQALPTVVFCCLLLQSTAASSEYLQAGSTARALAEQHLATEWQLSPERIRAVGESQAAEGITLFTFEIEDTEECGPVTVLVTGNNPAVLTTKVSRSAPRLVFAPEECGRLTEELAQFWKAVLTPADRPFQHFLAPRLAYVIHEQGEYDAEPQHFRMVAAFFLEFWSYAVRRDALANSQHLQHQKEVAFFDELVKNDDAFLGELVEAPDAEAGLSEGEVSVDWEMVNRVLGDSLARVHRAFEAAGFMSDEHLTSIGPYLRALYSRADKHLPPNEWTEAGLWPADIPLYHVEADAFDLFFSWEEGQLRLKAIVCRQ